MESKIRNHYENLSNQIDISTESGIENLNKNREEMFNKIKNFEIEKILYMKQNLNKNYNEPSASLMNEFETLKGKFKHVRLYRLLHLLNKSKYIFF